MARRVARVTILRTGRACSLASFSGVSAGFILKPAAARVDSILSASSLRM